MKILALLDLFFLELLLGSSPPPPPLSFLYEVMMVAVARGLGMGSLDLIPRVLLARYS